MNVPPAGQQGLLVQLKRQQLQAPNSWTSRYLCQPGRAAWPDRVREITEHEVGSSLVADHIMLNAQQGLERLRPRPRQSQSLGSLLIDGEVQSGKTISMIALTSYAIACSFQMIVVVAGSPKLLRTQTQARFEGVFGTPVYSEADLQGSPIVFLTAQTSPRAGNATAPAAAASTAGTGQDATASTACTAAAGSGTTNTSNQNGAAGSTTDSGDIYTVVKGLGIRQGQGLAANITHVRPEFRGLYKLFRSWPQLQQGRDTQRRPVLLAVVKKRVESLQAVEQLLQAVPDLRRERILIIDDEYDAATITSTDNILRSEHPRAWAQLRGKDEVPAPTDCVPYVISRIRALCCSRQQEGSIRCNAGFVGYTATSYAVVLANRAKYDQLGMRVLPDCVWMLEQHPQTTSYVGLQQLWGPGAEAYARQVIKTVTLEDDYVSYECFQLDAPNLPRAQGDTPSKAKALAERGGIKAKQLVHHERMRGRQPTGAYSARLADTYFRVLTDYLFSGAVRVYRQNRPKPQLLPKEQQMGVLQGLAAAAAVGMAAGAAGPAGPAAGAAGQAAAAAVGGDDVDVLAAGGWGLQRKGLVQLILGIVATRGNNPAAQAWAGAVLQSQLSESRTDEQVRLDRLLPDRPEGHRRTNRLLTGLGSMVQADLLRHQPTRIAWPADMAQHATQLFGSLDLFDPVADIASSFLWRVLDKACRKLGCPLQLHFMSWVRDPANNQIRLAEVAVKLLGFQQQQQQQQQHCWQQQAPAQDAPLAHQPQQLVLFLDPEGYTPALGPTVFVPSQFADAAARSRFAAACMQMQPISVSIKSDSSSSRDVQHAALFNPSNSIEMQTQVAGVVKQTWMILGKAVDLWLQGVQPDSLPADLEQQIEQWWADEARQRQLGLIPGTPDYEFSLKRAIGRDADGTSEHKYFRDLLLGPNGLLQQQWDSYRAAVQAATPPGQQPAFPDNPSRVVQELKRIVKLSRVVVVNNESPETVATSHPYNLFVGGLVMSRGITVEGLTVTMYCNASKTEVADVKIQAGRWFGHKGRDKDLLRVYMTERTQVAYSSFAAVAACFRDFLREKVILPDAVNAELALLPAVEKSRVLTQSQPIFELTGRSKQLDAEIVTDTTLLDPALDEVNARSNFQALLRLLPQLAPYHAADTLGELTGQGYVYHNVPLTKLQPLLSELRTFDGSTHRGEQLLNCLQHSGSKVQGVNVVIRRHKAQPKRHAFRSTNSQPIVVGQGNEAAGARSRQAIGSRTVVMAGNLTEHAASNDDRYDLYRPHRQRWHAAAAGIPVPQLQGAAAAAAAAGAQGAPLSLEDRFLWKQNRCLSGAEPLTTFKLPTQQRYRSDKVRDRQLDAFGKKLPGGDYAITGPSLSWFHLQHRTVTATAGGEATAAAEGAAQSGSSVEVTAPGAAAAAAAGGGAAVRTLTSAAAAPAPRTPVKTSARSAAGSAAVATGAESPRVQDEDVPFEETSDAEADAATDAGDEEDAISEALAAGHSSLQFFKPLSRKCDAPPLLLLYITDPLYGLMCITDESTSAQRLYFSRVYDAAQAQEARGRAAAYPVPLVVLDIPNFGGMRLMQAGCCTYPEDIAQQLSEVAGLQVAPARGVRRSRDDGAGEGGDDTQRQGPINSTCTPISTHSDWGRSAAEPGSPSAGYPQDFSMAVLRYEDSVGFPGANTLSFGVSAEQQQEELSDELMSDVDEVQQRQPGRQQEEVEVVDLISTEDSEYEQSSSESDSGGQGVSGVTWSGAGVSQQSAEQEEEDVDMDSDSSLNDSSADSDSNSSEGDSDGSEGDSDGQDTSRGSRDPGGSEVQRSKPPNNAGGRAAARAGHSGGGSMPSDVQQASASTDADCEAGLGGGSGSVDDGSDTSPDGSSAEGSSLQDSLYDSSSCSSDEATSSDGSDSRGSGSRRRNRSPNAAAAAAAGGRRRSPATSNFHRALFCSRSPYSLPDGQELVLKKYSIEIRGTAVVAPSQYGIRCGCSACGAEGSAAPLKPVEFEDHAARQANGPEARAPHGGRPCTYIYVRTNGVDTKLVDWYRSRKHNHHQQQQQQQQ